MQTTKTETTLKNETVQSEIGRRIISGAYGAGKIIGASKHTLEVRFDSGLETWIDRAGNIHWEQKRNQS